MFSNESLDILELKDVLKQVYAKGIAHNDIMKYLSQNNRTQVMGVQRTALKNNAPALIKLIREQILDRQPIKYPYPSARTARRDAKISSLKRWKNQIRHMLQNGMIDEAVAILETGDTKKTVMRRLYASIRKNDVETARNHFEKWASMVGKKT